jgi:hypothetical protein
MSAPPLSHQEILSPEPSEERLARLLHKKMEHLDPRGETWEGLTERDKVFYRSCIDVLITSGLVKLVSTKE